MESPASPPARSFWCFISYRHTDNRTPGRQWATWLHQQIETYEVPSDLVGTSNERGDVIPERIFPVFRDEDELPADADLASPIYRALDASKFLVVLCSPRAVASTYVANEIAYFKRIGRSDRVLAAMIDGEPNASLDAAKLAADPTGAAECFPVPLQHPVGPDGIPLLEERAEPIAADFRLLDGSEGWTTPEAYRQSLARENRPPREIDDLVRNYQIRSENAKLKIIAGILGVALGTLTQRDKNYQLEKARKRAKTFRRVASALGILTVIAAGGGVLAFVKQREAEAEKRNADAQKNLAVQREIEANEARAAADARRKEADAARDGETAQRKIAQTKEAEALSNLATARKEQYIAGIRFANDSLKSENRDTARETLLSLPESERSWEWDILVELAGPPALVFRKDLDPGKSYKGDPEIAAALTQAWKKLDEAPREADDGTMIVNSGNGSLAALFDPSSGRQGARLRVVRPVGSLLEPILDLPTLNYSSISGVSFVKDGSLMLIEGGPFRGVAATNLGPVDDAGAPEEGASLVYIIPVPPCIALGQVADLQEKPDSVGGLVHADWTTAKEPSVTVRTWNTGPVVSVRRNEGDEDGDDSGSASTLTIESPWQINQQTAQIQKAPPPGGDESAYKIQQLGLPSKELAAALLILAKTDGATRVLSSACDAGGGILALFNCLEAPHAAEVWNLSSNEFICKMGTPAPLKEDVSYVLSFRDIGGAISADGRYAMVSQIRRPASLPATPTADGETADSTIAIFDIPTGKMTQTLSGSYTRENARGAHPVFGFNHSGSKVFYSSYDGAGPENVISTFDLKTGRSETSYLRYSFWSPDGNFAHHVEPGNDALHVRLLAGNKLQTTLQQFCSAGEGPVYDEASSGHEAASGRYTIGRFLFEKGSAKPLVDLGPNSMTSDLQRGVLIRPDRKIEVFTSSIRNARKSGDRAGLSFAERMLLDAVRGQPE